MGDRGAAREGLTLRALVGGAVIGVLAAASNLYVQLKTGWTLPVATTAVLIFSGGAAATSRRVARPEIATLAACASAAGYMAGGGNVAALPSLVMLGGASPHPLLIVAWWCAAAALGTLLAPLLVAKTVDDPTLAFPTARAVVAVVESIDEGRAGDAGAAEHARGRSARRLLGFAALGGGVTALLRALGVLPATFGAPGAIAGRSLASLTFGLDASFVLAGAGSLMNLRTGLSTLLGGLVTYGLLAPTILARSATAHGSYREIVSFMVWPAAALLVTSAMLQLALDVPRVLRRAALPNGRDLLPPSIAGLAVVVIGNVAFGIPLLSSLALLPASLVIAFVAARVMGETDVVPTKALAPLAQLGFGAAGTGMTTTTMAPNVTSTAALQGADTLGSIRVARALGASQRTVLHARLIGCALGAIAVLLAYGVLVPDASLLPTADLPAPAILVWRGVSEVVVRGVSGLDASVVRGIEAGAAVGAALTIVERAAPKRLAPWVPSPAGLSSGMVLPASNAIAIALGSSLRATYAKEGTARAAYVLPLASGLIAGESLVGIAVQAVRALHALAV